MPTETRYAERLLPRWWVWPLLGSLVAMLAIAYGAALGSAVGWGVGGIGVFVAVLLVLTTAPRVEVTDTHLVVGAARLPRTCIAAAVEVDAAEIRRLRGPGADARLFVDLRPWSCPGGVHVDLDDPADPHPAWLFSSRHPARVVAALAATMGR